MDGGAGTEHRVRREQKKVHVAGTQEVKGKSGRKEHCKTSQDLDNMQLPRQSEEECRFYFKSHGETWGFCWQESVI